MDTLTPGEVRHIAKLPKVDGQKVLARRLHLNVTDPEEDLRNGSYLDYHFDVLQYAANRGMPWNEVTSCLILANDFFYRLISCSLPEAIKILNNLAVMYVDTGRLEIDNAKKIIQYFTTSVLTHHRLYQFVFMQERETNASTVQLSVEVPVISTPLEDAKRCEVWQYEQSLNDVRMQEQKKKEDFREKEAKVKQRALEIETIIDEKLNEAEIINSMDMKSAEDLISSLVSNQLDIVHGDIGIDVMKMKDATDVALAVQAIPVPLTLVHTKSADNLIGRQEKIPMSPPSRNNSGKSTRSAKMTK